MGTLSHTPPLSQPLVAPATRAPHVERRAAIVTDEPTSGALAGLLGEPLFRGALLRERHRADRFEEPFLIALISRDRRGALTGQWDRVAAALSNGTFDSDIVGWLSAGSLLGIIRPLGTSALVTEDGVEAAELMRRELAACLTSDLTDCSVQIDTYDPACDALPQWLLTGPARQRTATDITRAATKRVIDLIGSVVMLTLLAPFMVVIAALVKATSPGPVFYLQPRVGSGGRRFRMIKFRTIRTDADSTLHQQYVESYIKAGPNRPAGTNGVSKIVNDPRVTRVGRFLRRSSLDEVPQFWNVLVGEMSLVGPRPPLPYEVARYKTWHRRRVLEAKPGMTGLWQVTGRSRTSFDEMVRLDLRYARNHTLLNDLKILLATPRAVLSGRGAY